MQSKAGRAVACPMCADFFNSSRLAESEQSNRLAGVLPFSPVHAVSVHMARGLLTDQGGWLTLWGTYGAGKSLVLTGLVADSCRAGRLAQYWTGLDLLAAFQRDMSDGDKNEAGRGANLDFLSRIPVLALDEMTGFHTSSDWFARHFVELLDRRYRNADHLITIMALNPDPADWCSGPGGAWGISGPAILSRMRDGRFCRSWEGFAWPKGMRPYQELAQSPVIPGIIHFDAPDVRPLLRRGNNPSPAAREDGRGQRSTTST